MLLSLPSHVTALMHTHGCYYVFLRESRRTGAKVFVVRVVLPRLPRTRARACFTIDEIVGVHVIPLGIRASIIVADCVHAY